jgi:hypothetical protein
MRAAFLMFPYESRVAMHMIYMIWILMKEYERRNSIANDIREYEDAGT